MDQLTSNKLELEKEDSNIEIGIYDVFLPCRRYRINFKVAETGKASLTTEFLLRLIHSIDGMYESEVSKFFDFSAVEMTYLLNESVSLGYINRDSGRLWLTSAGRNLFVPDNDSPQIFNVDNSSLDIGFDQISFAPQEKGWTDHFDPALPELAIDPATASKGTEQVTISFKKHFSEIAFRREFKSGPRKSLYSIDSVSPGDRFVAIVPVVVKAQKTLPSRGEPDLTIWRSEDELDHRSKITPAVARFVDELRFSLPRDAKEQYKILLDLAPNLMGEYSSKEVVSVKKFYKEVVSLKSAGFRKNRTTIPIVGPLFTAKNIRLILNGLALGVANTPTESLPTKFYWRAPYTWHWGRTRTLPELIDRLSQLLSSKSETYDPTVSAILLRDETHRAPDKAFRKTIQLTTGELPRSVEILLVPGLLVAVLVHLPVEAAHGHAVPLGFVSVDASVIINAEELLSTVTNIETPSVRPNESHFELPDESN
ncbi:hypothetical protein ACFFQ5_22785 [Pseudomonas brassicacearum]|uniref:hypothetical protein n=1 Tax=Pseudomonas brassicacearum TaxID=930166 RepID=UPI00087A4DF1|nr:hypothetical protein [Pseudomonas brassicacearum]KAB0528430.1 hypothetical protein F7R20_02645 [Pseudomonas brassicacearum subsp. brassicacearum]NJP59358.1 hypothetical protein [Pseudomonas brassicacearum]SDP24701.1 hypothetical protein SAMN04490180_0759 [Pseudomonas brassicacearum]